jgi:phosphohistidine swiveling domain-containing protein
MTGRAVARPESLGRVEFAKRAQINVGGSGLLKHELRVPRVDQDWVSAVQHVEVGGEESLAIHIGNVGRESGVCAISGVQE